MLFRSVAGTEAPDVCGTPLQEICYKRTVSDEYPFDIDSVRSQFPALQRTEDGVPVAYLDGPGGTQTPRQVIAAFSRTLERGVSNLGGGFGADYQSNQSPAAKDYANALLPLLQNRVENNQLKLILEPGRSIAANAGILLTRVHYVKHSGSKRFIIVDAGMQTLIRPALYGSFHFIWPTSVTPDHLPLERHENMNMPGLDTVDIVGPICESGDFLAQNRKLPPLARGDLIAVFTAGAYGSVMSSRYNSTPLPAEVLVDNNQTKIFYRSENRRARTYHYTSITIKRTHPLTKSLVWSKPAMIHSDTFTKTFIKSLKRLWSQGYLRNKYYRRLIIIKSILHQMFINQIGRAHV